MNTDATDLGNGHVGLEELIASAAGRPVSDDARRHLAACERCQREEKRWTLVAEGVRGIAAAAPETPRLHVSRPVSARRRAPWRRALVMVASAAAALVLLIAVGEVAGVVHVRFGNGTEPVLTAVTGCAGLEQAQGTLTQVDGSRLVVQTASGQSVTVTTSASTFISRSGALLSTITDGSSVMVHGDSSGRTLQAAIVTVGQPFSAVSPVGHAPFVAAQGTVSNASSNGFTLVTSDGTRLEVTTSPSTLVVIPHATTGQLSLGNSIVALGSPADGTLSARAVAATSQFPGLNMRMSVKNCSPHSIIEALAAISAAGASAR